MAMLLWGLNVRITGSIYEDYKFITVPSDFGFINRRFIDADISGSASTLSIYKEIPDHMIIGREFISGLNPPVLDVKTMMPATKTIFLLLHGMCVNIDSGLVTTIDRMIPSGWKKITAKNGRIIANHIPAVFSFQPGGVVKSIYGDWNPATNTFTGSIEVGLLDGVVDEIIKS